MSSSTAITQNVIIYLLIFSFFSRKCGKGFIFLGTVCLEGGGAHFPFPQGVGGRERFSGGGGISCYTGVSVEMGINTLLGIPARYLH